MENVRIKWTEEDVAMLEGAHGKWPVVYPDALLQRHSLGSCYRQASKRGLTKGRALGKQYTHVTPTEWAYMAGIVDGEGTIHIFRHPGGRKLSNRVVAVANTNADLIVWMKEKFPHSNVYVQHHKDREDGLFQHRQPVTHVRWSKASFIEEMIEGMLPYLIIKKERAEEMLAHVKEM